MPPPPSSHALFFFQGGGMNIYGESTEVDIYATSFEENSADGGGGHDIFVTGATVTIHDTCPAGYGVVEGGSVDVSGTINGPLYSYTCPPCPAGSYSTSGVSCIPCGAGKYATVVVSATIADCMNC